ncbi:uncharacterized protein [Garra rufa]|uniref:uncharacterized protein n=1 Tax=Garra rufa TaxID=137080 RepID=UPI003CCE9A0A
MRLACHSKKDWADVKWKGGLIKHSTQQDSFSCGVFVMQMAKAVVQNFPEISKPLNIPPSLIHMEQIRKEMAEEIVTSSVFRKSHCCALCACTKPAGGGLTTDWIECALCKQWFHVVCLGMTAEVFEMAKQTQWACYLCD